MKTFDYYEFTGILAPGVLLVFGIIVLYPDLLSATYIKEINIGSLGIMLILSYIAGHLLQAFGNIIEGIWWKLWGGMPTDWVRIRKGNIIADSQYDILESCLPVKLGLKGTKRFRQINSTEWFNITRQVYATVAGQSRASRVDIFNGNYGLSRGIASSLLIISVLTVNINPTNWRTALIILVGAAVAFYRMHRFAKQYARELFVQFLQLPGTINKEAAK